MWKRVRWITASVVVVVLVLSVPAAIRIARLLSTPLEYDEQIAEEASNARGEVVAEHLRICFGLGAYVDYSIVLQFKGTKANTTLVEFVPSPDTAAAVVIRWVDNDSLVIDLGKVRSIWSQVDKVGSIHVNYVYTQARAN
jgi:hypothetical protein